MTGGMPMQRCATVGARSRWGSAALAAVVGSVLVAPAAPLGAQTAEAPAVATEPGSAGHGRATAERGGPTGEGELLESWARSYFPGRSGDVMIVPAEGHIITAENIPFMHGSPWDYDARIPLILYGPGRVEAGSYGSAPSHQDVGATLAAALGLPRLASTTGRVLEEALVPGGGPPRILALVVLDAFRHDYLEHYADSVPHLRRLAREGASWDGARVNYLPTATAVTHTTLVTGSDPRFHGITGNVIFDRARGEAFSAFEGTSARNVMGPSLADRWSVATGGVAVIAAQGGTFYPAAALAGHGACFFAGRPVILAYLDSETGGWASNPDCYTLPAYLSEGTLHEKVQEIRAAHPPSGPVTAESQRRLLATALAEFEGETAVELLRNEPFGADSVPDLLLVNLKATDRISHAFGPFSVPEGGAVAAVDRKIGAIVQALEERAGSDGYLLVVTADHGMPPEPDQEERRHTYGELIGLLHEHFDPRGPGIVLHLDGADNQIYLDRARMAELELTTVDVARYLAELPFIRAAFPEEEVARAAGK